jgi:hypothetical protein
MMPGIAAVGRRHYIVVVPGCIEEFGQLTPPSSTTGARQCFSLLLAMQLVDDHRCIRCVLHLRRFMKRRSGPASWTINLDVPCRARA